MIYTIGHSTLSIPAFLSVIKDVDIVIDVRSHPGSKSPQFQKEELERWLPAHGKQYLLDLRLGGWRADHLKFTDRFAEYGVDLTAYANKKFPKQRIAKELDKSEPSWWNQGFWDYQFFMMLEEFHHGIIDLIKLGSTESVGILCAENLWWKCHRSMISDYLLYFGVDSIHLQPKRTKHSDVIGNRLQRYHPDVVKVWQLAPPPKHNVEVPDDDKDLYKL